ncbi:MULTISPECIES: hypothetical protein [unclassified Olleya]|jgi:hypothetical protein|uniref:hypothetical protein n=1 Tax=unclassified Olleya TaxID=2615019 RepID=UPI0011ADECFE|nr:hypothetical protein [Olleya sp. Hel_I_94]TVZ47342.1 hypothetical protein JM82_1948 [Olleya sp. Hel_I_94]
MKTILTTQVEQSEQNRIEMVDFYNEATEDYEFWSKANIIHFDYSSPSNKLL